MGHLHSTRGSTDVFVKHDGLKCIECIFSCTALPLTMKECPTISARNSSSARNFCLFHQSQYILRQGLNRNTTSETSDLFIQMDETYGSGQQLQNFSASAIKIY